MAHVRQALATGRPFRLLSAPGAAATLGVAWWQALAAAAGQPDDILDCGADAGAALEALRAGQRIVVLRGPFAASMTSIAANAGGRILSQAPPAFDLAHRHAPDRLIAWLDAKTVGDRTV